MSLILYSDDNTIFKEIQAYKDTNSSTSNQSTYNYTFNPSFLSEVLELEEWIKFRNNNQTFNLSTNIRGKTIGDYTCKVKDTVTGRQFYARIDINTSESDRTRHYSGCEWQQNGRTFSLSLQEVEV